MKVEAEDILQEYNSENEPQHAWDEMASERESLLEDNSTRPCDDEYSYLDPEIIDIPETVGSCTPTVAAYNLSKDNLPYFL